MIVLINHVWYALSLSLSLRWWCWGGQSATKARTQQYLDRPPLFLQGIHAEGLDWIEMPLLVLFYYYYYYYYYLFFLAFSFWVVGLIDFGLLVVVDLILVVLWLLACDSFGLWACLWWWWFLVVVVGGHERERERERERGDEICGVDDFVWVYVQDLWCNWMCCEKLLVFWMNHLITFPLQFLFLIIPHFDLVSLCYYVFFFSPCFGRREI